MIRFYVTVIFSIAFVFSPTISEADDFLVEEDLTLNWTFFDDDQRLLLPFLSNSYDSPAAIHLLVDKEYGNNAKLRLAIPENTSIFIEGKYIDYVDETTQYYYLVDSLKAQFDVKEVTITLFNEDRFEMPISAKVGYIHVTFNTSVNVNPVQPRELDRDAEYFKIIILIIFTFFVVIHFLFPSELREFYSIGSLITFRFTDTFLTKFRTINKIQSLIIVFQASMLSAIMVISISYYNNPLEEYINLNLNPIFGWLIILLITLSLLFFKYVLISSVSYLFGISERTNFYFIEFLRLSMLFYTLIFVAISYVVINHFYSLESLLESLIYLVVVFNLLRFAIIYFKFQRNLTIKNLHLFSYLCTTELIPIVMGLNFFIK